MCGTIFFFFLDKASQHGGRTADFTDGVETVADIGFRAICQFFPPCGSLLP